MKYVLKEGVILFFDQVFGNLADVILLEGTAARFLTPFLEVGS